MILKCELKLSDLRFANNLLLKAEENCSEQNMRVHWFLCLSLARSIGHVLKSENNGRYEKISSELLLKNKDKVYLNNFELKKGLFGSFIKTERDAVQKDGKYNISLEPMFFEDEIIDEQWTYGGHPAPGPAPSDFINEIIKFWDNHIEEVKNHHSS